MKLCIALHDVAPATWPECEKLLALIESVGAPRVTLLVVPDFHRRGRVDASSVVRRGLDRCQQRGDEIALHGYFHLDDAALPRNGRDWFRRRILTAGEGEFAALDEAAASERIDAGRDMFARAGWSISGFVPPAWLAGTQAQRAIRASGLRYTSDHHSLVDLRSGSTLRAPVITASARTRWRRAASSVWLRAASAATSSFETIRAGLHPEDARHEQTMLHWKKLLLQLLATREGVTKTQALSN